MTWFASSSVRGQLCFLPLSADGSPHRLLKQHPIHPDTKIGCTDAKGIVSFKAGAGHLVGLADACQELVRVLIGKSLK